MKKCKKCGKLKSISDYYDEPRNLDGKCGTCIECVKSRSSKYREENRDVVLKKKRDYYQNHKEEKAEYDRIYRENNKSKISKRNKEKRENRTEEEIKKEKIYQQQYRINNKEKLLEQENLYRETHKEEIKASKRRWQQKHREEIYEKNKKWNEENPEKVNSYKKKYKHKRRAILQSLDEHYTNEELQNLIKNSDNICYWCGNIILDGDMHIDHVIPLTKGGTNTIDNLVVSCSKCNLIKSDRMPEIFLEILRES